MRIINDCNYPSAIIRSMEAQQRKPHENPRWISVTELIDSPQIRRLKRANFDKIEVKASSLYASWRGTVLHDELSRWGGEGSTEERLEIEVGGWTLSGKPDHAEEVIDISVPGILRDYKNKNMAGGFGGPEDRDKRQVNIYRWLVYMRTGVSLEKLVLNYFYQDWKSSEARYRHNYPPQHEEFIIPAWGFRETEEYVKARLAIHEDQNATCSAPERWQGEDIYAVKKKGSSRAVNGGKWPTREQAQEMADDLNKKTKVLYEIEARPGEARRCQMYCSLLPFCSQGQALTKEG